MGYDYVCFGVLTYKHALQFISILKYLVEKGLK